MSWGREAKGGAKYEEGRGFAPGRGVSRKEGEGGIAPGRGVSPVDDAECRGEPHLGGLVSVCVLYYSVGQVRREKRKKVLESWATFNNNRGRWGGGYMKHIQCISYMYIYSVNHIGYTCTYIWIIHLWTFQPYAQASHGPSAHSCFAKEVEPFLFSIFFSGARG